MSEEVHFDLFKFKEECKSLFDSLGDCPGEFMDENNSWRLYAKKMLAYTQKESLVNVGLWQWKALDDNKKRKQLYCLSEVLWTDEMCFSKADKEILAAWMLSEMLLKIPE